MTFRYLFSKITTKVTVHEATCHMVSEPRKGYATSQPFTAPDVKSALAHTRAEIGEDVMDGRTLMACKCAKQVNGNTAISSLIKW